MKKVLAVLLPLLVIGLLFGQGFRHYDTKYLYYDNYGLTTCTVPVDSIQKVSGHVWYKIHTIAAGPDTLLSRSVFKSTAQIAQTIYAGLDSLAGTTKVYVEYGVYRGWELGWNYTVLDSLTSDGDNVTIDLSDLAWAKVRVADVWNIRLRESGNQRNRIWIRIIEYYY